MTARARGDPVPDGVLSTVVTAPITFHGALATSRRHGDHAAMKLTGS
jgi:hypothetical protein